jgi:hypothetical protein
VIFESDLQSVPSIAASQRQMYQRNMSSSLWRVGRIEKLKPTAS